MISELLSPIELEIELDNSSEYDVELELDDSSEYDLEIETALVVNKTESVLPKGGAAGALLTKISDADYNYDWVMPADASEPDNTRPITAAAVYLEIGNINALLGTI